MASSSAKPGLATRLRGKGGYVVMVLAALLGLGAYLDSIWRPPPRQPGELPLVSSFVGLRAKQVDRIEIKRASGTLVMVKQGDVWKLTEPIQTDADADKVEQLLEGVLDAAVMNDVGLKLSAVDLQEYGLGDTAVRVTFHAGRRAKVLLVGDPTPGQGDSTFAAAEADGRLFTLPTYRANDFKNLGPNDYREMRLVRVDIDSLQVITIKRADETVELVREDEEWVMLQPHEADVDGAEASSVASALNNLRAEEFVAEDPQDLAQYGLDQPRLIVTVVDDKGSHTVAFGKEAGDDGNVYARRQGDRAVATVAKSSFADINTGYGRLRDRTVLSFDEDDVTKLAVTNQYGSVEMEKRAGQWWIVKPIQVEADETQMADLITTLAGPANSAIEESPADLAKYGLEKPEVTVVVWTKAGDPQTLFLGKESSTGSYYIKSTGPQVFDVLGHYRLQLQVKAATLKAQAEDDGEDEEEE